MTKRSTLEKLRRHTPLGWGAPLGVAFVLVIGAMSMELRELEPAQIMRHLGAPSPR